MSGHFLGIDIGLSGARAAVLDRHGGLKGSGRHVSGARSPAAELNADDWVEEALVAGRMAVDAAGVDEIAAVGIGALGPVTIVLDAAGTCLFPPALFGLDARSEDHRRRLQAGFGLDEADLGPDHALPKLFWLQAAAPDAFARANLCVDAAGFVVGRLTGHYVMDHITRGYFVARGVPQPVPLPEPMSPLAIAGGLADAAARRLGIAAGTPVTVGAIDSYVDMAGTGATRHGDAVLLAGTTLILGRIQREARPIGALRVTGAIGEGGFLGGWTSAFGSTLDWAAGLGPGHDGGGPGHLLMLPYLSGERAPVWNPSASGVCLGLTQATTLRDLCAAAGDGVLLSALDIGQRLTDATGPIGHYRATGGTLAIPHFGQRLADALGAAIEVVDCGEARAAAMLAAAAAGIAIPRHTRALHRPDPRRSGPYAARLAIYRDLYAATAPLMARLNELLEREKQWPEA